MSEENKTDSEIVKVLQEQLEAERKKHAEEIEALKEESKQKEKEYANQVKMILSGKSKNEVNKKEEDEFEKSYYEEVLEKTKAKFKIK